MEMERDNMMMMVVGFRGGCFTEYPLAATCCQIVGIIVLMFRRVVLFGSEINDYLLGTVYGFPIVVLGAICLKVGSMLALVIGMVWGGSVAIIIITKVNVHVRLCLL